MPTVKDEQGNIIAKMPYDEAGGTAAEKMVEDSPNLEIDYGQNNVTDASSMREQMYAGGGKTGYNAIGNPMYKKGGPVMDIPGEQVKWATEVTPPKKKEKKDKKPGFFSKEKRVERKKDREKRKADAIKKSAEARKENKKAGVKTGEMKVPGGQVKWGKKRKSKRKGLKDMPFGSQERIAEYKRRDWKMDETTHPKKKKAAPKKKESAKEKARLDKEYAKGAVSTPKSSAVTPRKAVKDTTTKDYKAIHKTMKKDRAKAQLDKEYEAGYVTDVFGKRTK